MSKTKDCIHEWVAFSPAVLSLSYIVILALYCKHCGEIKREAHA